MGKQYRFVFSTFALVFGACGDQGGGGPDPVQPDAGVHAVCGNNTCEAGETSSTCPADCHPAVCGNNLCETGETALNCSSDCTATMITQNNSSYYIYHLYVASCGSTAWGTDWLGGQVLPPNYQFTLTDITPGCYWLRAEASGVHWQDTTGKNLNAGSTFTWPLGN